MPNTPRFDLSTLRPDFQTVLARYDCRLTRGRGPCPICRTSATSTAFSVRGEHARCFACGWRGDVFDLVAVLDNVPLGVAIRRCAAQAGLAPMRPGHRPARRPPDPARERRRIEGEIFRTRAYIRDVFQWIADDPAQPLEVRAAALAGVSLAEAEMDAILNGQDYTGVDRLGDEARA